MNLRQQSWKNKLIGWGGCLKMTKWRDLYPMTAIEYNISDIKGFMDRL